jgi:drug/metabolite transporter (DMT)-like permease
MRENTNTTIKRAEEGTITKAGRANKPFHDELQPRLQVDKDFSMTTKVTAQKQALDITAVAILIVLCSSWGVQHVAIKVASNVVSPIMQCCIRSIGATVLVWVWMLIRRQPILEKDGTLWWGITIGGLFGIEFLLIYWGLEYTNASRAVIFLYLCPFVIAIGVQLFLPSEKLRWPQVAGLCCAFTGIVVAFSESLRLPSYRMLIGDAMLGGAAVLWGTVTIMIKASSLARINSTKTLLYQLAGSAIILPLAAIGFNEPGIGKITPFVFGLLFFQTVWIASITYIAWFWLVRYYPAARLSSFIFLTPLLGVIAGGVLLNEPISSGLLLAVVLVATGIYLVNRPEPVKMAAASP